MGGSVVGVESPLDYCTGATELSNRFLLIPATAFAALLPALAHSERVVPATGHSRRAVRRGDSFALPFYFHSVWPSSFCANHLASRLAADLRGSSRNRAKDPFSRRFLGASSATSAQESSMARRGQIFPADSHLGRNRGVRAPDIPARALVGNPGAALGWSSVRRRSRLYTNGPEALDRAL